MNDNEILFIMNQGAGHSIKEIHITDPGEYTYNLAIIATTNYDLTINIYLDKPNIDFKLLGVYFLENDETVELQTNVFHNAKDCKSSVLVKGALKDKSQFNWSGDVKISNTAHNTETFEENRNLILNKGPRVVSIPNLEILTGNIIGAGHASATSRFDENQLFYFVSRGIDEVTAKQLVLEGFIGSVLDQINNEQITEAFNSVIANGTSPSLRGCEAKRNDAAISECNTIKKGIRE